MRSHHLLVIWASLLIFSHLPLCSSNVQEQNVSGTNSSSTEQTNSVISLPDGREIQADVPLNSSLPVIFHYKDNASANRQPLIVTVRSPGREIIIYARRTTSKGQYNFDPALNGKTADFSSLKHQNPLEGIATISVPPFANNDASETMVVIAVYFNYNDDAQSPKTPTTFTILASSEITHLFTGAPYTGSVTKDHYAYFLVPIMRSDCTLLISLANTNDEGDAGLVVSYNSKARPTISDHQYASIPHSKTRFIEIDNNDISPTDSMSGNLVIGVYGNTTSSFTLTVIYQDQKMIDLQPGVPVEMTINQASPVKYQFFHESKNNLQVQLKKFSGELNLYMTCLNTTQNLATSFPDQTNHKWQISHADSQAFINIPMQDPQACFSCLYFINIEAVSPASFQLLVEGNSFIPLQEGLSYPGHLTPQESAAFELRTSSETEEAELRVDTQGSELEILVSNDSKISLTNYIWKKVVPLDSKGHLISLTKSEDLQTNSFYILLYNPTYADVSYNFTTAVKSSKTFPVNGGEQTIVIKPYQKISLLYYSNAINEKQSTLQISRMTAPELRNGSIALKSVESALSQGQIMKARFWAEEKTPGPGQEVSLKMLAPELSFSSSLQASISQAVFMKNSKGKYLIEVVNPWEFALTFSIEMKTPGSGLQLSAENLHYQKQLPSPNQTYEIFMPEAPLRWYSWVHSCDGSVDLAIQSGNKELKSMTLSKGESYLHKEIIQNDEIEDRFKYLKVSANPPGTTNEISMHSVLFDDSKFFDYEVKEGDLKMSVSYTYMNDYNNNRVQVEFTPVEFQDPDPTDNVHYEIKVCPLSIQSPEQLNFCHEFNYCMRSQETEISVNQKESVRLEFGGLQMEQHAVMIKATVIHKKQMVRFVGYPVSFVDIKSTFWFDLFVLVAVILGIVVIGIFCVICGKRIEKLDEQCVLQMRSRQGNEQELEKQTIETESLKLATKNHRD